MKLYVTNKCNSRLTVFIGPVVINSAMTYIDTIETMAHYYSLGRLAVKCSHWRAVATKLTNEEGARQRSPSIIHYVETWRYIFTSANEGVHIAPGILVVYIEMDGSKIPTNGIIRRQHIIWFE